MEGSSAVATLRRWKRTEVVRFAASVGLASRAIVYGALTVLVVEFTRTHRPLDTDQGSALADLSGTPGGDLLLVLLLAGVVAYTCWRWLDALTGPVDGDHSPRNRALAVIEGAGYLPFGYFAIRILTGDPQTARQGQQYRSLSGSVLEHEWGVALTVVAGVVVIVVGSIFCLQGLRRSFRDHFDFPRHRPWVRSTVLTLGTFGSVARGLIFIEAGVLVIVGASRHDPKQVGGLDSALDTLAGQSYGTPLLLIAALGFAAFALFALAEAVWRER